MWQRARVHAAYRNPRAGIHECRIGIVSFQLKAIVLQAQRRAQSAFDLIGTIFHAGSLECER